MQIDPSENYNQMNETLERNLIIERNNLHRTIDFSFNNIYKNLRKIFEDIKINDQPNSEESVELELTSNLNNLSNELSSLLDVINNLKLKQLTTFETKAKTIEDEAKNIEKIKDKFDISNKILFDLQQKIIMNLRDWKSKNNYIAAKEILGKNK